MADSVVQSVPSAPGKGKTVVLWVLQVPMAAVFLAVGCSKLVGSAPMVELFKTIGVGQWFRYVTGGLEVIGGIVLLIPGMAAFGAALLACIMAGAILTHLTVLHTGPTGPVVLLAVLAIILWGRWNQIARRMGL
jgi:putative oxidoreductase